MTPLVSGTYISPSLSLASFPSPSLFVPVACISLYPPPLATQQPQESMHPGSLLPAANDPAFHALSTTPLSIPLALFSLCPPCSLPRARGASVSRPDPHMHAHRYWIINARDAGGVAGARLCTPLYLRALAGSPCLAGVFCAIATACARVMGKTTTTRVKKSPATTSRLATGFLANLRREFSRTRD